MDGICLFWDLEIEGMWWVVSSQWLICHLTTVEWGSKISIINIKVEVCWCVCVWLLKWYHQEKGFVEETGGGVGHSYQDRHSPLILFLFLCVLRCIHIHIGFPIIGSWVKIHKIVIIWRCNLSMAAITMWHHNGCHNNVTSQWMP